MAEIVRPEKNFTLSVLYFAKVTKVLELMERPWHDEIEHVPFGLILARNDAPELGGNTVVAEGPITAEGMQRFGVYACPEEATTP